MAISDDDYADALSYYKLQQAQAQHHKGEQGMLGALTQAAGLGGVSGGAQQGNVALNYPNASQQTWISNNTQFAQSAQHTIGGIPLITQEDLKHEAMQVPLSVLIDMWTVRWGGEWVSQQEFAEDKFWSMALSRLVGVGKLEKHCLANAYHPVYRIIE